MQLDMFPEYLDYSETEVLLGLSGGINSMAVLCWLSKCPPQYLPKTLHLFYAHLSEHSPDTFRFVADGVRFSRRVFPSVKFQMVRGSVIEYFESQKMIPHPTKSPCTRVLKLEPMFAYMAQHGITENVVGYVKGEAIRRASRMAKRTGSDLNKVVADGVRVRFPISSQDNEWCFDICRELIGWYPAIYDIRDAKGNRVFKHNNCLPCKNMEMADFKAVGKHYPEYMGRALALTERLKRHWGRDADDFYTTFGREEWEATQCEHCTF